MSGGHRCKEVLDRPKADQGDIAWCVDYLGDGSAGKPGSCCKKDDEWDAWCGAVSAQLLLLLPLLQGAVLANGSKPLVGAYSIVCRLSVLFSAADGHCA